MKFDLFWEWELSTHQSTTLSENVHFLNIFIVTPLP